MDECQNFLTLPRSFDEMLAEARGYRLSLVLAHQDLAQLPRELRDAVSANARNKLWFTCSPEDAHALERHVTPELSAHDLAHLGAYQAAARLVADGAQQPAFTLATRPAPPGSTRRAAEPSPVDMVAVAGGDLARAVAEGGRPPTAQGSGGERPSRHTDGDGWARRRSRAMWRTTTGIGHIARSAKRHRWELWRRPLQRPSYGSHGAIDSVG